MIGGSSNLESLMGEWDAPVKAVKTRKRRGLKIFGIVCGAVALFVIAAYFVVTSAWFLKAMVLPRLSAALGATVTVEDVSLSPFSAIKITGLKVQAKGSEPLARAEGVRVRYSLFALMRGQHRIAGHTSRRECRRHQQPGCDPEIIGGRAESQA